MTAYLVVRASLSPEGGHFVIRDFHYQPHVGDGGQVQVPEAVFVDRAEADRDCDQRERAARELLNPFCLDWGDLESLCSASPELFRARLVGLGLNPPPAVPTAYDGPDWRAWWFAESPAWPDEQRAAVWDLLDNVRLFEVLEIELE